MGIQSSKGHPAWVTTQLTGSAVNKSGVVNRATSATTRVVKGLIPKQSNDVYVVNAIKN